MVFPILCLGFIKQKTKKNNNNNDDVDVGIKELIKPKEKK